MNDNDAVAIEREISIHKSLNHPNIVKMYNAFVEDECIFIILEFMENGNIFRLLRESRVPEDLVIVIMGSVLSAVKDFHEMKIVHRDIKPENVLWNKKLNFKLSDFGFSAGYSDRNSRNTMCGTTEYLAPEIIENFPQDDKVDIWCLGILLYEFIHQCTPFDTKSMDILLRDIKTKKIAFASDIKREFKEFIELCLIVNPKKRPNANDLLERFPIFDLRAKKKQIILQNPLKKSEEEPNKIKLSESKNTFKKKTKMMFSNNESFNQNFFIPKKYEINYFGTPKKISNEKSVEKESQIDSSPIFSGAQIKSKESKKVLSQEFSFKSKNQTQPEPSSCKISLFSSKLQTPLKSFMNKAMAPKFFESNTSTKNASLIDSSVSKYKFKPSFSQLDSKLKSNFPKFPNLKNEISTSNYAESNTNESSQQRAQSNLKKECVSLSKEKNHNIRTLCDLGETDKFTFSTKKYNKNEPKLSQKNQFESPKIATLFNGLEFDEPKQVPFTKMIDYKIKMDSFVNIYTKDEIDFKNKRLKSKEISTKVCNNSVKKTPNEINTTLKPVFFQTSKPIAKNSETFGLNPNSKKDNSHSTFQTQSFNSANNAFSFVDKHQKSHKITPLKKTEIAEYESILSSTKIDSSKAKLRKMMDFDFQKESKNKGKTVSHFMFDSKISTSLSNFDHNSSYVKNQQYNNPYGSMNDNFVKKSPFGSMRENVHFGTKNLSFKLASPV